MSESNENSSWSFSTKAIHSGQECEQWKNLEIVPPIVTSMTYYQKNPSKMEGYYYSRMGNPTRDTLQNCIAALENAKYAQVYPSGCAALTAVLHLFKSGDHILAAEELYGGSTILIREYGKQRGIEVDFVDATDEEQVAKAIKPNTKLIWIEIVSNPCLKVTDVKAIANLAHSNSRKILVEVDNTFLTPYFSRPLELGADISMYSLTKYMNGHNDVCGGALALNNDEIYEKLSYNQTHCGSLLSPFDCYLVNRGLKTLEIRMDKHCASGIAIAEYLDKQPNVLAVMHPALKSHPHHERFKSVSSGHCGMLSFHLKGNLEHSKKFIQNLRVISSSGSLGGFESFAMIPGCVSHYSMSKEMREKLGIYDTTVRLSIGLENVKDLIADLEQAFKKTFA